MSTLNQEAPPAQAPKNNDFVKLEVFPKSDGYVLTIVAFNYIAAYPFERTDEATKEKYIKEAPAVELFFGTSINGKPYFTKTWPQSYSLNEKSNYSKYYSAATGAAPKPGSKPNDLLGKFVMGTVAVEDKVSAKKRTPYKVSTLKSVAPVPSILANSGTPIEQLHAAFEAAIAGKDKEEAPF